VKQVVVAASVLFAVALASAQQLSRIEVGAQAGPLVRNVAGRVLSRELIGDFSSGQSETRAAIGGRFTLNFARTFAIESEFDFLPGNSDHRTTLEGGNALLFLAGPKAGIRRRNFGVFGKARVGVLSFASTYDLTNADPLAPALSALRAPLERRSHLAVDIGGVFEYYPSKRTILRVDASDLIVRYGDTLRPALGGPVGDRGRIGSSILLTAGVGYRVGRLDDIPESVVTATPRFEVGAHFSLLSIEREAFRAIRDDPGVGARFTWNFSRHVALDTAVNFFPARTMIDRFAGYQDGGSILQSFAGVKAGVRREHWGVFAKFRPGMLSYSRTVTDFSNSQNFPRHRTTHWALDMGGVLEWYPTRRTIARFDVGDTTVFLRPTKFTLAGPSTYTYPSSIRTAIQVSTGFGLRF